VVSTQGGDLVTEHQDLDAFGCVGAGEERHPARHTGERSGERLGLEGLVLRLRDGSGIEQILGACDLFGRALGSAVSS
jgi:hypothetical protein